LRNRQIGGYKFRRQVPIGNYIVDFVCFETRLIIEVDGGQHAVQLTADEARTDWLQSQGFTVLRFWNNDVLKNTAGVVEQIREHLTALTLSLSHKGRGYEENEPDSLTPHPSLSHNGRGENERNVDLQIMLG